jgi:hypothetical protein
MTTRFFRTVRWIALLWSAAPGLTDCASRIDNPEQFVGPEGPPERSAPYNGPDASEVANAPAARGTPPLDARAPDAFRPGVVLQDATVDRTIDATRSDAMKSDVRANQPDGSTDANLRDANDFDVRLRDGSNDAGGGRSAMTDASDNDGSS